MSFRGGEGERFCEQREGIATGNSRGTSDAGKKGEVARNREEFLRGEERVFEKGIVCIDKKEALLAGEKAEKAKSEA